MKIILKKQPRKYLGKLSATQRKHVIEIIYKLPDGDVKKLVGREGYRIRIGNLRVLFDMEENIITIRAIKPRGEAYK